MGLVGIVKLNHIALLEVIGSLMHSDSTTKLPYRDKIYVWASWKLIEQELPMLDIGAKRFKQIVDELVEIGFLVKHPENETLRMMLVSFGPQYEAYTREVSKREERGNKFPGGGEKNFLGGGEKNFPYKTISNKTTIDPTTETPTPSGENPSSPNAEKLAHTPPVAPAPPARTRKAAVRFIPPTLDEVKAYFGQKGYTEEAAAKFFEYYEAGSWTDAKGTPVKNWKQKALSVWFKPENRDQKTPVHNPARSQYTIGQKYNPRTGEFV